MTTDASNDIIKPTRTSSRDVNNGTKMTTHATNYNKPNPSTRSIVNDAYHAVDDFVDSVDDYVDKEIEEAKQASRAFRRRWVPVVKSTLASLADVIGDWVFYFRTKNGDAGLDEFENPIYFFCIISSVLSGLAVLSIIFNNCSCLKGKNEGIFKKNCLKRINWIMGLEMFLEDIPQVVLTTLVLHTKAGGVWSPVAVFNVTTSAFNFTFNVLDMCMPLEEEHHIEAANAQEA